MHIADKREFLRISQAVGMGFLIMGVIGYIVKLSKCRVVFVQSAGTGTDRIHFSPHSCEQHLGRRRIDEENVSRAVKQRNLGRSIDQGFERP